MRFNWNILKEILVGTSGGRKWDGRKSGRSCVVKNITELDSRTAQIRNLSFKFSVNSLHLVLYISPARRY